MKCAGCYGVSWRASYDPLLHMLDGNDRRVLINGLETDRHKPLAAALDENSAHAVLLAVKGLVFATHDHRLAEPEHARGQQRRRRRIDAGALLLLQHGQPVGLGICLLYTSPSPRDRQKSRMPSSA